jgi:hypothetical protein
VNHPVPGLSAAGTSVLAVLIAKKAKKVRFAGLMGICWGHISPKSGHISVQPRTGKISSTNLLRPVNRFRRPHVMFM